MSVFSGDFLGFSIGGIHSEQLNIFRVSSGDRYDDNLIPNFKDATMEIPGGDGTYYQDSFYSARPIPINFAYDDLRDEDLRRLRQVLGFKGIQPLIFDEFPYKKYMVKSQAPPNLKYISFDYKDIRLYKGEGTVTFIAYYPYAVGVEPMLFLSNTKFALERIDNIGDIEMPFKVFYSVSSLMEDQPSDPISITLRLEKANSSTRVGYLRLKTDIRTDTTFLSQSYLMIDSKTHLIEGLDANFNKTGVLFNKYIDKGDFFNMPVGVSYFSTHNITEKIEATPIYY